LTEIHSKLRNVQSFYGGKLYYKKRELIVNKVNIYYRSHYEEFKAKVEDEIKIEKQNKVILKLDIENYFGEISIPILLDKLESFIKPSVKSEMKFDIFTKDQILFFFSFMMKNMSGIPQSENNIISNFIGYLYMSLGDFILDDLLKRHSEIILDYKVIRFVDDIYVSIRFSEHISYDKQKEFTLYIASEIAESLYTALKLRLNLKTRAYHLVEEEDAGELLSRIKDFADSHEGAAFDYDTFLSEDETETVYVDDAPYESNEKPPQELLDDIFEELDKLKNSNVEEFFIRSNAPILSEEVFQSIFKKSVYTLARKTENREKLGSAFEDFNFDLIKVKSLEIIILLLLNERSKQQFRNFLLQKKSITTSDADLIIKYLCQVDFEDRLLLSKLSENQLLKEVVSLILEPKLACAVPGHYSLTCMHIRKLSSMPEVIEQIRMRVFHERSQSYSVALNHLLNEIHGLCIRKEAADKRQYDVNDVFKLLTSNNIPCETRIKIRNLFDRRNSNGVSHPGSGNNMAWEVTKEEYLDYYKHVGECFERLLI
jgi:AbiA family abortive infection protein